MQQHIECRLLKFLHSEDLFENAQQVELQTINLFSGASSSIIVTDFVFLSAELIYP